jgi:hypothetical protein
MWLARYFPGLNLSVRDVAELTPEETLVLKTAGLKHLNDEAKERLAHTKAIATAAGFKL